MKTSFALIVLCLVISPRLALAAVGDQAVKLTMQLSPAGNFTSGTDTINGSATKQADGSFKAEHVIIPLKTLNSGIEVRDEHMKNKYLEVDTYPNAEIVSASGHDGKGSGQLKVKDITQPVSGTYVVEGDKLHVKFAVKLSDYKFEHIRYMGVGVKDEAFIEALIPFAPEKTQK